MITLTCPLDRLFWDFRSWPVAHSRDQSPGSPLSGVDRTPLSGDREAVANPELTFCRRQNYGMDTWLDQDNRYFPDYPISITLIFEFVKCLYTTILTLGEQFFKT